MTASLVVWLVLGATAFVVLRDVDAGTLLLLGGAGLVAVATACVTLDLLLRRRVELATATARRAHEQLRGVMNSAPDGILALDPDGRVTDGNPAAVELLGVPLEQLLGRDVHTLLVHAPAAGERLETRLCTGAAGGEPVEAVLQIHPDGSGSTVLLRDIRQQLADRAQLEQHAAELERLNAELTSLDAMKRDFVSMASHEVRTPITAIRGFSLTLSRRWDELSDADRIRCFEVIHRQTDRLWRVIDDLLVASRIEAGSVDAEQMATNVATLLARAIDDAGVPPSQVVVACPSDLDVVVVRDHLRRIVTSFLSNARKYGEAPFEITADHDGDGVAVRVRDHGVGVDESFRRHLFDTFTQASTGITRTSTGTGLGLAVARGLAEAVEGTVWYEPAPDGGACFGVRLPATRRAASPATPPGPPERPADRSVLQRPADASPTERAAQRWASPDAQERRSAAS
ncbi:MAG: ATP-binding protein [Actinomycetes bacterium]